MKILISFALLALAALGSSSAHADAPTWAYPVNPPAAPVAEDDGKPRHVPASTRAFTWSQIAALKVQPPDWHPDEHPPMPGIVGRSREPGVYACGYCHLPNGAGRPENASLAGLSAHYIKEQLAAFREGHRAGSESARYPHNAMVALAKELTTAEIEESAAYFAALPPREYLKVIESATVPRTEVAGWTLRQARGTATEPIGNRIIEMAVDFERFENRDSRTPYVAYVPEGSLVRGAALVTTGAGRTLPCAGCHGAGMKGLADVPRLAGRSPSYLYRQLNDIRNGNRTGGATELMQPVVAELTDEDMVAIVAYLSSLRP